MFKMTQVPIPEHVKITWGDNFILVNGPKGTLIKEKGDLSLALQLNQLVLFEKASAEPRKDNNKHFYHKLFTNLIIGVTKGYRKKLRLVGVGFRASVLDKTLILKIGYSHDIRFPIPDDISIFCGKLKGTRILIQGIELQRVTQTAAEIRALRIPDVYKGKGILYNDEVLILKKGKREGK